MGNILCEKDILAWYLARAYLCKVIALQQDDIFVYCLFVLLLYVPSQQLWSWRDCQFI